MKILLFFSLLFVLSCDNTPSLTPDGLKIGTFKTILDKNNAESIAVRDTTFQKEMYNGKEEVFKIHWKSDFEYILKKENPKNALDSTDFIIKITGIHKKYYTFKAHYKGSNYTQKGKAIKISD